MLIEPIEVILLANFQQGGLEGQALQETVRGPQALAALAGE